MKLPSPSFPPWRRVSHTATVLLLLAACAACGSDSPVLQLRLRVVGRPLLAPREGPVAPAGQPPPGIDAFRLCVLSAAGQSRLCQDYFDLTQDSVRLEGVPAGDGLQVTFQGYNIDQQSGTGDVLWCGRVTGVSVARNQTTPVHMTISRCRDFSLLAAGLNQARMFHSADLLPNGQVLLAGGYQQTMAGDPRCGQPCAALRASDGIELYDPGSASFQQVGHLTHPRGLHASMVLSDGRVLVAGGCEVASLQDSFVDLDRPGSPLRCLEPGPAAVTAEVVGSTGNNNVAVEIPFTLAAAALPLGNDRLGLFGGLDESGQALDRVLVLSWAGGELVVEQLPGALEAPRAGAVAVATSAAELSTRELLLLGGHPAPDPSDPGPFAEWLVVGGGGMVGRVPRFVSNAAGVGLPVMHAVAARTAPGRIVVAGGILPARYLSQETPFLPRPLARGAVIDAASDSLQLLGQAEQPATARLFATLSTPPGSHPDPILLAGGFSTLASEQPLHLLATAAVEVWEPQGEGFSLSWLRGQPVRLNQPRAGHSATWLLDGTLLLCGGSDGSSILTSCELYNPQGTVLEP